jgi:hypothetical protein
MNYNVLFYKLNHQESTEVFNQVSGLPFKVVKICIDKVGRNKIPQFVNTVPLLKTQSGEIFTGNKLKNWCSTFCRGSGSSSNQNSIGNNTGNNTGNNNGQNNSGNKNNMEVTGDMNISPIYSQELGGFSDNYSFLTDNVDSNKVEQIQPIDHSFSFLGKNDDTSFVETQSSSSDKNSRGNELEDAFNKFKMEREKDCRPAAPRQ